VATDNGQEARRMTAPRSWNVARIVPAFRLPALGVLALAMATGCVERRYTVRTDPPGALVFVNGEEIGPSPVSRSFTYYGPREIVVQADGYRTERVIQPIRAPWYDNYATEFFTENLIPYTWRDERDFLIKMQPATVPSTAELSSRADGMRQRGTAPPPPRSRGLRSWFGAN
jgi:hypothetical protein